MKAVFSGLALVLFLIIVFGLFWFFFLGPSAPVGLGWYIFSFTSGLTMIVLACTFPLVFVIVPLSLGKGPVKGLLIALLFSLGVVITLSIYGILAAIIGQVAIGSLGAPLEMVKNWLYFIAGSFAYLFALGQIGLINFHMPTYTGGAPSFIQKQKDYLQAVLLGLFLGNVGVGCPHPATPVILTRIAVSGDVFYGWLLFLVHAVGRVIPLILVALLGILGVSSLDWLVARKIKLEQMTGWGMVFVAGFILTLGLFTHDWWVYSGQHIMLEQLTQEELVVNIIGQKIGGGPAHGHVVPTGTGLFDLPLWLGNWVLVGLWLLPLWWYYFKKMRTGIWPFVTFSLLLGLVIIYVLPDRFLFHRQIVRGEEMVDANHEDRVFYHEAENIQQGLTVNFSFASSNLIFAVQEKPWNTPVTDLELGHERFMHVMGARSDLNEFFHIHPTASSSPGVLAVDYNFKKPGSYKIWSEVRRRGSDYIFGHPMFAVEGEGPREEKDVSFGRNIIVGNYQVGLTEDGSRLTFHISTVTGGHVNLDNWLGEKMHLVAIKDDLSSLIHLHPGGQRDDDHHVRSLLPVAFAHSDDEERATAEEDIVFDAVSLEAGLYKIFAQFRPVGTGLSADEALAAGFWIKVGDRSAPAPVAPVAKKINVSKPLLVIISLIAMTILGWLVRRFISRPKNE